VHSDSDSTTAQVQRKLKTLGYYDSSVDGAIGPKTRAAIRAYQEENSLEITGQIDKTLLASLGL
jgi:peptidoglycan hydrolase-like protein with peptidoglycan-binding domain